MALPESEAKYVREVIFERGELRATGDMLQSSASRLAEFVLALDQSPYEVHMAALEAQSAVEQWTEIRRAAGACTQSRTPAHSGSRWLKP